MKPKTWFKKRLAFFLLAYVVYVGNSFSAPTPKVTGTLSNDVTTLDRTVSLHFTVTGEPHVDPPKDVVIDGLDVRLKGTDSNFTYGKDSKSESVTFSYTLIPQVPGVFTIPTLAFVAGKRTYKSNPLSLTVLDKKSDEKPKPTNRKAGFAELFLSSTNGKVGEPIAIEVCFYFDNSFHCTSLPSQDFPQLKADGFIASKLTKIETKTVPRYGLQYMAVTFLGIITPTKAGKLAVGPADFKCRYQLMEPIPSPEEMLKQLANKPQIPSNSSNYTYKTSESSIVETGTSTISSDQKEINVSQDGGQPPL